MSIRARQFIFSILAVLFFVAVPLVIFYAIGYRYNFNKKTLEKTGSFVLDSKPQRARILIDGRDAHKLTPSRFTRLLPGDYRIRLEKENYYPWEKTLKVESKLTTFATDIVFFKNEAPTMPSSGGISSVFPSNDKKSAALLAPGSSANTDIFIWDLSNQPKYRYSVNVPDSQPVEISWSPANDKILLKINGTSPRYFIVPIDGEAVPLASVTDRRFNSLIWSGKNNSELWGSSLAGGLHFYYRINLEKKQEEKIGQGGIILGQTGSRVYVLSPAGNGLRLLELNLANAKETKEVAVIKNGNYHSVPSPENLLTLIDPEKNRLYLIDPSVKDGILFEQRANYASWSPSQKRLLLSDGFEINIYDHEKNSISFITRYGKIIKKALWLNSEAHVIIEFDDSVSGIELDSRDTRYSPTLVSGKEISDLFLDALTENAYFTAVTAEGRRIFRLPIQ